jgi:hypothetical protein
MRPPRYQIADCLGVRWCCCTGGHRLRFTSYCDPDDSVECRGIGGQQEWGVMKRDLDLVRLILKEIEEVPAGETPEINSMPGYDRATVNAHLELLIDADLVLPNHFESEFHQ